jgi:hypothetical protein
VVGLTVAVGPRTRENGELSLDLPSSWWGTERRELLKASSQSLAMLLLKCLSSSVRKTARSCGWVGLISICTEPLVAQLWSSLGGLQWLDGEVMSRS